LAFYWPHQQEEISFLWLPLQLNLIKLEQRQMEIEWVAGTCGLLGRVPHDIATAKVTLL